MHDQRLPPPPQWEPVTKPKLPSSEAQLAFETAAAETTARIRSGFSLPASPDTGSRRRYGSEPPPSPLRRSNGLGLALGRSGRLLGVELPQPPLPPVAGELRLRLEALEQEAKRGAQLELERIRGACAGLQQDLAGCRSSLEEKARQEEVLQKEVASLRSQLEGAGKERHRRLQVEEELLRLKSSLAQLEQEADDSRRLEMERQEELRQAKEALWNKELQERQLKESDTQRRQEVSQKQSEVQRLQSELQQLRKRFEDLEEDRRNAQRGLKDRERLEAELRDAQAQRKHLAEETRVLKLTLKDFEEERGRSAALEHDCKLLRVALSGAEEDAAQMRQSIATFKREEASLLQSKSRLEQDCKHLRKALKQRESAEKELREALAEQRKLRDLPEGSPRSPVSPMEPMARRRAQTTVDFASPSRGFGQTMVASDLLEVDLTSRRTSQASSLVEVDMTGDM